MSSINSTGFGGETPDLKSSRSPATFDILKPLRKKLDNFEIQKSQTAHLIAKLVPAQCPFERTIKKEHTAKTGTIYGKVSKRRDKNN